MKNVSSVAGKEVCQLYIGAKQSMVARPVRELKAFDKIELAAGEKKKVVFTLSLRDFAYYCEELDGWRTENGIYTVSVGGSSRELPLSAELEIKLSADEQPSQRVWA